MSSLPRMQYTNETPYASTGQLPSTESIKDLVAQAY